MGAACPSDETLVGFVEDELTAAERNEFLQHFDSCARCRKILELAGAVESDAHATAAAPLPLPEPGSKLGRYHVLDLVGRGAMGAVYGAYDPQLRRRVALKVQLPAGASDPSGQDRFLREAQAMASVSHPNVISVHDVGVHEGVAFFAMEFVEGQTLRSWLEAKPAPSEVLAAFAAAGRGMAAAHDQGLVHRDFKPDNVLVGDDDRVRVIDFGLVRFVDVDADPEATNPGAVVTDAASTKTGTLVGTPAYMAPEQLHGRPADARSDQFSFCVALYEALVGSRPFTGETLAMLVLAMGKPVSWPSSASRVPRRIRQAIEQGLHVEPEARLPSMHALVAALQGRRWDRWIVGGAVALGVAGIAVATQSWLSVRAEICSGARDQLAKVWDDSAHDRVREGLLATNVPVAAQIWGTVERDLDAYAEEWIGTYTESCEATSVRQEASSEALDLRIGCLRGAKTQLSATVDVLASADSEVVLEVPRLLASLPRPTQCSDVDRLGDDVDPPVASDVEVVEQARAHLAHARAERTAGRFDKADAHWIEARALAQRTDYGPLQTELSFVRGQVLEDLGRYEAAEHALAATIASAGTWHQWDLMRDAATRMIGLLSTQLGRPDDAEHYVAIATGLARGDEDATAAVSSARADLLTAQGDYGRAETLLRDTIADRVEVLGADDPSVLDLRDAFGVSLVKQGRFDAAQAEHRAVFEARLAMDPEHPRVAESRNNLGVVAAHRRDYETAEAEFQAALELYERIAGQSHPRTLRLRANRAQAWGEQGRKDEAVSELREVIARWEASSRPDHRWQGEARNGLAKILYTTGKLDEAVAEQRAAIGIVRRSLHDDHPDVAMMQRNLGVVLGKMGENDASATELRAALAITVEALGDEHPHSLVNRSALGIVLHEAGRDVEAAEQQRLALAAAKRAQGKVPVDLFTIENALARALIGQGRIEEAMVYVESAWSRFLDSPSSAPQTDRAVRLVLEVAHAAKTDAALLRARALAEQADRVLDDTEAYPGKDAVTAPLATWLEAHPVPEDVPT